MWKQLFVCGVTLFLWACSDTKVPELEPTPLVVSVRIQIDNGPPKYMEKYFVNKLETGLKTLPHVVSTHGMALTNEAVITVFYEDGVKFSDAEFAIKKLVPDLQLPVKPSKTTLVELCGADLSHSNLAHIAQNKGLNLNAMLNEVVPVEPDLASNMLPKEEFDAMFHNECDEVSRDAPLYILEE